MEASTSQVAAVASTQAGRMQHRLHRTGRLHASSAAAPSSTITQTTGQGGSLTLSTTRTCGQGPGTGQKSLEDVKTFLQSELATIFSTGVCSDAF